MGIKSIESTKRWVNLKTQGQMQLNKLIKPLFITLRIPIIHHMSYLYRYQPYGEYDDTHSKAQPPELEGTAKSGVPDSSGAQINPFYHKL